MKNLRISAKCNQNTPFDFTARCAILTLRTAIRSNGSLNGNDSERTELYLCSAVQYCDTGIQRLAAA
jgi:hypothetical protein